MLVTAAAALPKTVLNTHTAALGCLCKSVHSAPARTAHCSRAAGRRQQLQLGAARRQRLGDRLVAAHQRAALACDRAAQPAHLRARVRVQAHVSRIRAQDAAPGCARMSDASGSLRMASEQYVGAFRWLDSNGDAPGEPVCGCSL